MDEVDGMSAGDRGGIAELILIIKKTKIPIICICNDRQSPKVKSLVNHCFDMRFYRPRANEVEKAIMAIGAKYEKLLVRFITYYFLFRIYHREGLSIQSNVVENLVKSTSADIRQILNMLSTYSLKSSHLSYDEAKTLLVSF